MNISAKLYLVIIICILSTKCIQAEDANDFDIEQNSAVSIELTHFEVTDANLELSWKIINNTDHDVWICDSIGSTNNFEVYMTEDNRILVIRRRLDVPSHYGWRSPPSGSYVRLHPGEIRPESLLLNLPVQPRFGYASRGTTKVTDYARCLTLEIGFYNEDLPALIRSILQVAEKFSGTTSDIDVAILEDYFRGLWVLERFGGSLEFFEAQNKDPYIEGWVEFYYPYQALAGEKILRILVDGVSIPYEGYKQSISLEANEPDDSPDVEQEQSVVSMELTHFEVNDTKLELGWKIKNNTDHDVWICDRSSFYDVYVDTDAKTLILRRRFNLPCKYVTKGFIGRYVRLRSGQEKAESISLDVPIGPSIVFHTLFSNAELATRLALEIGFYDEDLPEVILEIVDFAEKLNCVGSSISLLDPNSDVELYHRYFGGVTIEEYFNSESFGYFRNSVISGGDEILIPYMWQALNGEQVLRLDIDGVSIPIKSINPPLMSKELKKIDDKKEKLRSGHNKEKPDLEEGSDQSGIAKK